MLPCLGGAPCAPQVMTAPGTHAVHAGAARVPMCWEDINTCRVQGGATERLPPCRPLRNARFACKLAMTCVPGTAQMVCCRHMALIAGSMLRSRLRALRRMCSTACASQRQCTRWWTTARRAPPRSWRPSLAASPPAWSPSRAWSGASPTRSTGAAPARMQHHCLHPLAALLHGACAAAAWSCPGAGASHCRLHRDTPVPHALLGALA